ncbi:unnamed protein product [Urochloa humidicola]
MPEECLDRPREQRHGRIGGERRSDGTDRKGKRKKKAAGTPGSGITGQGWQTHWGCRRQRGGMEHGRSGTRSELDDEPTERASREVGPTHQRRVAGGCESAHGSASRATGVDAARGGG